MIGKLKSQNEGHSEYSEQRDHLIPRQSDHQELLSSLHKFNLKV
jgi:hypothetical protein